MPVVVFKIASQITTPIPLTAFVIACLIWLLDRVLKHRGKISAGVHSLIKFGVLGLILLAAIAVGTQYYSAYRAGVDSVYRVRVTVVARDQEPIENATVWSSVGGEPKKVSGGWEFDVPSSTKPVDDDVIIYAKVEGSSLKGEAHLHLGADHNPSLELTLQQDESALVRGIVEDDSRHTLKGVRVSVVGYGQEAVITSVDGGFVLRAHAGDGHTIRLHAEAQGYQPLDQDQPVGSLPASLFLHRNHVHH